MEKKFSNEKWQIVVNFNDEHHIVQGTIEHQHETEQCGTETLQSIIGDSLLAKLKELKWKGYGLWAQHEAIYLSTTLNEINYQRDASGRIVLDCENHACKWRAIKVPFVQTKDCLICLEEFTEALPFVTYICMHSCVCNVCNMKLKACPLCRKPFKREVQ